MMNILHAEISKEQLYKYLEISVGGAMFFPYHHDILVRFAEQGLDKEFLKGMVDDEKYLNLYTSDFSKLNDKEYNKMVEFYKTDVGRKYAKSVYDMAKIDRKKIKKLYEQNKCSNNKQALINKIEKELNLVKYKNESRKETIDPMFSLHPNSKEKSRYETQLYNYEGSELANYDMMISCILFKDFTLEELNKIYDYASSEVGRLEIELAYKGFSRYIMVFMADILAIKEKREVR